MLDTLVSSATRLVTLPGNALSALVQPMDAIFNIPLVSVLLLPSLSSWSTSFNVLFFYATWSLLLLSHSPLAVEFFGTLAVRLVFFVAPSLLFLALDALLPFAMRRLKRHGARGIATSAANGGWHPRTGRWLRVVLLACFNLLLGVALQTAVDWVLIASPVKGLGLGLGPALRVTRSLPLPWAVIKHLVGGYVLREVITYATHRWLLHCRSNHALSSAGAAAAVEEDEEDDDYDSDPDYHPPSSSRSPPSSSRSSSWLQSFFSTNNVLTRHLSSRHAAVFHGLHTPVPFSAHYDDPLAYVVRVWLPAWLPAALLRFHLLTYHLWLALLSVEEALTHSNYAALPTGLVLGGVARRAERHLATSAAGRGGNFGVYGLADLLMGTTLGDDSDDDDDVLDDIAHEALRRDIPRRAHRKVRALRDKAADRFGDSDDSGRGNGSGSGDRGIAKTSRRLKARGDVGNSSSGGGGGSGSGSGVRQRLRKKVTGSSDQEKKESRPKRKQRVTRSKS